MAKVKQSFSGLKVPQQIERSRLIIGKMTGNADYATPAPPLSAVISATDALETAYNASRGRDKVKTAEMRERRKDLLFLIGQLAAYVQQASGGDVEKILGSGFDTAKQKTPHSDTAGTVYNVQLGDGSGSGKTKATWNAATDAITYFVEVSMTFDFSIIAKKAFTTKTQKELDGTTPGTTYYVRVTAIGREEAGTVSEPAHIIAR